jgi:hypothetical protein
MLAATTTDSKSVTIDYQVDQTDGAAYPIQFGIYRSSDDHFDTADTRVALVTLVPPGGISGQSVTLDQFGQPAAVSGNHALTIPLPQGLPPYPRKPFVLVVADPGAASALTDPAQTASFRTVVVGVVTHGGLEDTSWKHGPPWELEIARIMRHQGYDAVIAYNWVDQSSSPGAAVKQSPRLAHIILDVASRFPAADPIDLHFIGHSEGAVVNTYAIASLEHHMTSELKAGYIEDTLLDPHAATNQVPGRQYSVSGGLLGRLADALISNYQAKAKDPPVVIPSIVDEAQVFYQHTAATKAGEIYNLWGQVPVKVEGSGPVVQYFNLTAAGVTHSGNTGVPMWFRNFIAPTLGDQAPLIGELRLDGQIDKGASSSMPGSRATASTARRAIAPDASRMYGQARVAHTSRPTFSGVASPGSIVRLYVGPAAQPSSISLAGWTNADPAGHWVLSTRPLRAGRYRAVVMAFSRALRTRPAFTVVPTQPLGQFVVAFRARASSSISGSRYPPLSRTGDHGRMWHFVERPFDRRADADMNPRRIAGFYGSR